MARKTPPITRKEPLNCIMMHKKSAAILLWVLAFILAAIRVLPVSGEEATSTNFRIGDTAITDFGGGSTSSNFELINAGGEAATGESSSTNYIMRAGPLFFDTFGPKSQNWRWYDDEVNETPTSPLAPENTAPNDVAQGNIIKLRLTIRETENTGFAGVKFKLQYSKLADFSAGVQDVAATSSCLSLSAWCYYDAAGVDNATITTALLSDAEPCSGGSGSGCGTHNETPNIISNFIHNASTSKEYEFTVINNAADSGTTYYFRAYEVSSGKVVPLNTGKTYPSLTTKVITTLTFTISGLPAGTTTEGIVTDVSTAATSVPFGTLPFGIEIEAAQRLTIDTNASSGYQIFTYQRQDFLNEYGDKIPPAPGTNASPQPWSVPATSSGAFGYHPSDDTLSGPNPARFAPNNTYARFATSSEEIAFDTGPASNQSFDLVIKLEVKPNQFPGNYQTQIVYIATPTY